ncbi:YbjN domain-containing protein [Oryzobacter telluris]|uniref:YbjN domain-containing protein n=1 Tax=Oryzobacter telluris TaxID=3149179 RepID=UPI00370D33C6
MTDVRAQVAATVEAFLVESGLEWEGGARSDEYVVSLPGEKKLKTVVSLVVSDTGLSATAFVMRNPDENHVGVYRFLLRRNLRLPGLAYAVDGSGDVYVAGRLPAAGVDATQIDQLLGVVLTAADEPFNELLVMGFLTSMRKEWEWRVSRGESLRNLEAFRHLLERPGDPPPTD